MTTLPGEPPELSRTDTERVGSERRRFPDANLIALVNPDYWTQTKTILEQVQTGTLDILLAHGQIMAMLTDAASTDRKTGLFLGEAVEIKLGEVMNYCRAKELPLSTVYLDCDKFKALNDKLGHATGDRAIKIIGKALKETTRKEDLPARLADEDQEDNTAKELHRARMGGDEFVLVLPEATADQARMVLERFITKFSSLAREEIPEYESAFDSLMTISAGIAEYDPSIDWRPLEFLRRAENAMMRSKKEGRGGFKIAEIIAKPELERIDPWLEQSVQDPTIREHYRVVIQNWQKDGKPWGEIAEDLQREVNINPR